MTDVRATVVNVVTEVISTSNYECLPIMDPIMMNLRLIEDTHQPTVLPRFDQKENPGRRFLQLYIIGSSSHTQVMK
jgi:hypothetical protein